MKANGQPVPEVFAVIKNGKLYDVYMNSLQLSSLSEIKDFFVKQIDGECASYVKHVESYDEFYKIFPSLSEGTYILQKAVAQSDEMKCLNPKAINTFRVVTIYNNGEPYVLSSILRIGTNKSNCVDNWAAGGLVVGVKKDGWLKEHGFYKPGYGTKVAKHPDTKIEFSKFKVTNYDDVLNAACSAHKCFYEIGAIGWDIAITSDGPMFIEGNDNFEISLMQAGDRGLKKDYKAAVKQINS